MLSALDLDGVMEDSISKRVRGPMPHFHYTARISVSLHVVYHYVQDHDDDGVDI